MHAVIVHMHAYKHMYAPEHASHCIGAHFFERNIHTYTHTHTHTHTQSHTHIRIHTYLKIFVPIFKYT